MVKKKENFALILFFFLVICVSYVSSADITWILPIGIDVPAIKQEFGAGNDNVRTGFSIGFEYLSDIYIHEAKYTNPNDDYNVNLTYLEKYLQESVDNTYPLLVHLNGHRWTFADYIANNAETMMYTQKGIPITMLPEWNDQTPPLVWGIIPKQRVASYMFSLNEYNTIYRSYKKRNIQQVARRLAAFANEHPQLFVGVSLDSEISLCPAGFSGWKNYEYSFDYNTMTIVQWRYWLSGNTGSYIQGNLPNPYAAGAKLVGKGKNFALSQLKSRYENSYSSWDYVYPPEIYLGTDGKIITIYGNAAMVDDWLEFKASLVNNLLAETVDWVEEAGIPRNKIYTHQPPIVKEYPDLNEYCGIPFESAQVDGAGYGTLLYGSSTLQSDYFNRIKNLNNNWGVFEWNPTSGTTVREEDAINSLQSLYNNGADIIVPNYYIPAAPPFPQDPLELFGNTNVLRGIKAFIVNNNHGPFLPVGFIDPPINGKTCSVYGWTCDESDWNTPLRVKLYINDNDQAGERIVATITADKYRGNAVKEICGNKNNMRGFEFVFPEKSIFRDSKQHKLYALAYGVNAYGKEDNSNKLLGGSPAILKCDLTFSKGDLNHDNLLDIGDVYLMASYFNSYNSEADLNKDNKVDLRDLVILVKLI